MAQLLIRNLTSETIEAIKSAGNANGRSTEAEAHARLESKPIPSMEEAIALADDMRARFTGRIFNDSTVIIRELRGHS